MAALMGNQSLVALYFCLPFQIVPGYHIGRIQCD